MGVDGQTHAPHQHGESKGVDLEKEHDKRRDAAVTLRQRKLDELLRDKRHRDSRDPTPVTPGTPVDDHDDGPELLMLAQAIPELAQQLRTGSPPEQRRAAQGLRRLLSQESMSPINEVIAAGCVQSLSMLLLSQDPVVQLDAAWALTNIAGGTSEQCQTVVDAGACPRFVTLLAVEGEVRGHALWALGNVAGDSPAHRDAVIQAGAVPAIAALLQRSPTLTEIRTASWVLANTCRRKPCPPEESVRQALPVLCLCLTHQDNEVVTNALWGVHHLSDGEPPFVQALVSVDGLLATLVGKLASTDPGVVTPALRTLGNIVAGPAEQTQRVLDAGLLPALLPLMQHPRKGIRKDCCWILSNVAAGTDQQVQAVAELGFPKLLVKAMHAYEAEVRREALFATSNFLSSAGHQQILQAVHDGALQALTEMLAAPEAKALLAALDALDSVLRSGEWIVAEKGGQNAYRRWLRDNGAVERVEELQHHESNDVYTRAQTLLEEYYQADDEVEDPHGQGNLAPDFGPPQTPLGAPGFDDVVAVGNEIPVASPLASLQPPVDSFSQHQ